MNKDHVTQSGRPRRWCLIAAVLVGLASCAEQEEILAVELPSTPVLTLQSSWALITSSHLRLRSSPSTESAAVATLWRGYVLEILSRGSRLVVVDDRNDFWYQVRHDGLHGWVFGAYLEMFDSRAAAEQASREANR